MGIPFCLVSDMLHVDAGAFLPEPGVCSRTSSHAQRKCRGRAASR